MSRPMKQQMHQQRDRTATSGSRKTGSVFFNVAPYKACKARRVAPANPVTTRRVRRLRLRLRRPRAHGWVRRGDHPRVSTLEVKRWIGALCRCGWAWFSRRGSETRRAAVRYLQAAAAVRQTLNTSHHNQHHDQPSRLERAVESRGLVRL